MASVMSRRPKTRETASSRTEFVVTFDRKALGVQKLDLLALEGDVVENLDGDIERRVLTAQVFEQRELARI
jgi:hypothetical protein